MGYCIKLVSEDGEELESIIDWENKLPAILPQLEDRTYRCLGFVDPYGDTVFNHPQSFEFLREWSSLKDKAHGEAWKVLFEGVKKLVDRQQREPHLYLKFLGD